MTQDMPGRIYAWFWNGDAHRGQWCTNAWVGEFRGAVEYVLASRLAEVEAANRGLVRLNEATQNRAEAAEAKLAVAREALRWAQHHLRAHGQASIAVDSALDTLDADITPAPEVSVGDANFNPCAALENAVLSVLPGQYEHPNFGYDYFSCLAVIADDAGIDKEAARFACKRLRDKGLALYQGGLFTEDGIPCGSGYALTDKGRAALRALAGEEG